MDVSGLFRIWLDFFSEIADMNHDGAHILVNPVGVPKIIEDLAACKHPVRISGEKNQKFKFFCCKVYRFPSDCDGMSGKIDFQIAGRQNVLRRRGVGSTGVAHILSAEVCLYPGNQFGRAEGFRDIIISADGKTQYLSCEDLSKIRSKH